jgi:hypothetical protein
MLTTAAILFALGALGGLVMAISHFRNKRWPLGLAVVHGLAGAAGLVLLAWALYAGTTGSYLTLSLTLLVVAALGGFVLFANHLRGRPLPSAVVVIHALVAAGGFLLLLVSL